MRICLRRREFIAGLGGAAAWPTVARAQQRAMPVVRFLDFFGPRPLEAFRAGLAEQGFVEGRNLFIEYRSAGENSRLLPELTTDLVRRRVSVIVAAGAAGPALAAKAATSTIPIVFGFGGDPVTLGLVASLNRPGGNITGINTLTSELLGKRLDLLLKLVPQARKIGFLSGTLPRRIRGANDCHACRGACPWRGNHDCRMSRRSRLRGGSGQDG